MGCVYVGKGINDQHYKIGRTGEVQSTRKKQHRTANPSFEYHLVIESEFSSEIESRLHNYFGSKRVEGTKEWFKLTISDLDKIKNLSNGYENELLPLTEQVEKISNSVSIGTLIKANATALEDYQRLREIREQKARLEDEEEFLQLKLKVQIGLNDGIEDLVSWKSSVQNRFDSTLFRKSHSDLYDQFRRPVTLRVFRVL